MVEGETENVISKRPERAAKNKFKTLITATNSTRKRKLRSRKPKDDPTAPKLIPQQSTQDYSEASLNESSSIESVNESFIKVEVTESDSIDKSCNNYVPNTDGLIYPIRLKEISELNTFYKITSDIYECDVCSVRLHDYQSYVKHVTSHVECHAVCALCPKPDEPFSSSAFASHIVTHFNKNDDDYLCQFCNMELTSLAGHELVQHLYFFCKAITKCLICLSIINNETPEEHRLRRHGRLLDRFLCTTCLSGFPSLKTFENHQCQYVLRCVCDLCEKFDSIESANLHVSTTENQDDHGILIPEQKGVVLKYIINPHAVEAANYEQEAKTKFFNDEETRLRRKRKCTRDESQYIYESPPHVSETEDSTEEPSPPSSLTSDSSAINVISNDSNNKIDSPPSLNVSSSQPILVGARALKTTYMNKMPRLYPIQQSADRKSPSTLKPNILNKPVVLSSNPAFRLSVSRNNITGTIHNPFGETIRTPYRPLSSALIRSALDRTGPLLPVPRLVIPKDKQISAEMRNKYLNHKRIYGMYQNQNIVMNNLVENMHTCICGMENVGVQSFVQHLEMNHFHDSSINSETVPRNSLLCVCLHCMLTFESSYHYKEHLKRHEAAKQKFKYCQCCSLLWDPTIIYDHLRQNKTNWVCGRCNIKFLTEMAFFCHVAEKDHSDIFYFCKGCNIGSTQPEPIIIHTNKCTTREGLGFILVDYLQHRPLRIIVYRRIMNKYGFNVSKYPSKCKNLDLYIKSGDIILRNCCKLLHLYNENIDKIESFSWCTERVCANMFIPFQKTNRLPKDWHITFEKLPLLYPRLEDTEVRPIRNTLFWSNPQSKPKKVTEEVNIPQARTRALPKPLPKTDRSFDKNPEPEIIELED